MSRISGDLRKDSFKSTLDIKTQFYSFDHSSFKKEEEDEQP